MKTLGYVNRFSRGIHIVQELLGTNKNGRATFIVDDLTTFKVSVNNAYTKKNVTKKREKELLKIIAQNPKITLSEIALHNQALPPGPSKGKSTN